MTKSVLKIMMLAGGLALGGGGYAEVVCPEGDPDCNELPKGNNGWGNGPDTTNPGSPHGATADSKMSDGADGHPRQPKFTGR